MHQGFLTMTKMKKIQVDDAMKYYREIGKLAFKSSINHHSVIKNSGNNESKLLKMMAEDRAKISRLENVIDIKSNYNFLWILMIHTSIIYHFLWNLMIFIARHIIFNTF